MGKRSGFPTLLALLNELQSLNFKFPDRMERQTLDVGAIKTRWVRLVIDDVFSGTDPDTAISEVTFEGESLTLV